MTNTTKGKVEAINDRESQDWYGVLIDDDWYNGDDSLNEDIEKGDEVAIKFTEQQNADSSWMSIENIKRTGGSGPNSESRAGGASNSSTHLSKNERILVNTAFQKAVDKVSLDDASDQGEHLEQVNSLTNGYIDVMKKQMNEFEGESDE